MDITSKIISYIKSIIGIKVYENFVPESANLPASSFLITSRISQGALSGGVDLRTVVVQVDVVCSSTAEVERLISSFQSVENLPFNNIFQLCHILGVQSHPVIDSNQTVFGASIDLQLTPYL